MTDYIGVIRKEAKSDFGVDFPDFPGCVTAGSTVDEARVMAQEALLGHIESMMEEGIKIPRPSNLKTFLADRGNADATTILVSVPDTL